MRHTWALSLVAALCLPGLAPQDKSAAPAPHDADAKAFVDAWCLKCQGPEKQKAKLDVSLALTAGPANEPRLWRKIDERLRDGVMPPDDSPQPPAPKGRLQHSPSNSRIPDHV